MSKANYEEENRDEGEEGNIVTIEGNRYLQKKAYKKYDEVTAMYSGTAYKAEVLESSGDGTYKLKWT